MAGGLAHCYSLKIARRFLSAATGAAMCRAAMVARINEIDFPTTGSARAFPATRGSAAQIHRRRAQISLDFMPYQG
jgi:hypothetical protein